MPRYLALSVCIILLQAPGAESATIPSSALVDFTVDAWADVGNGPYTNHVSAWQNTGVFLNAGDEFALRAEGIAAESLVSWENGGRTPDGDGGSCGGCIADIPESRYALVGRIGESLGSEFFVGSSFSGVAAESGYLYLGFNDNHFRDNYGSFTVNAVPEPTSVIMLATGLVYLSARRRPTRRWS